MFFKLLCLAFTVPFSLFSASCYLECPFCNEYLYLDIKLEDTNGGSGREMGVWDVKAWRETWTCPDINCGYRNMMYARYCGICGTEKPQQR